MSPLTILVYLKFPKEEDEAVALLLVVDVAYLCKYGVYCGSGCMSNNKTKIGTM